MTLFSLSALLVSLSFAASGVKAGFAAFEKGKLDEAEAKLTEAVTAEPDDADARMALALVLSKKKLKSQAIVEYREAVRLNPDYEKKRDIAAVAKEKGWTKKPTMLWSLAQQELGADSAVLDAKPPMEMPTPVGRKKPSKMRRPK